MFTLLSRLTISPIFVKKSKREVVTETDGRISEDEKYNKSTYSNMKQTRNNQFFTITNKSINIMKKIFYCMALTLVSSMAFGQKGFHTIGVGVEGALPMGDFADAFSIGYGATGKALYGITENGDITGTVGYLRFGMKDETDFTSGSMGMIPIMFGYRHNFSGLYAEPQFGLHMLKSNVKIKDDFGLGLSGIGGSASETKFSLGIGGGYATGKLDFGARFQIVDNMNYVGLRIGYNFSL